MKKIIGITICFVLLLMASLSIASEGNRVVYVDLQEALNSADSGKKAKEIFKVEVDRIQKDLDKKQDELKSMKDDLEKKALLLSEETRVKKEQEYQEKLKKFQRFYQDAQDKLKSKDEQLTRNIMIDLRKVITRLGQEKGYAMILEKNESNVLYAPRENDITSEVVKRLNEGVK